MKTTRFKLIIAFDGANYAGWQTQKNGVAVQQLVEKALKQLFPNATGAHGSSRTDSGVHALGLVAHVDIPVNEVRMPEQKVALAINALLPSDIRVMWADRTPGKFHARFDAVGKEYRYDVWNDRVMNPLRRQFAWHVPKALDMDAMRAAAAVFPGRRDFASFAALHSYKIEDTVRTLFACDIRKSGELLTFVIEGEGFLYKMCRGIVGTLVQVGQGKYQPEDIARMLAGKDRRLGGMSAPAHGLTLWKVYYRPKARWREVIGAAGRGKQS